MKCPYKKSELRRACVGLDAKLTDELSEKINDELLKAGFLYNEEDYARFNKDVAQFHGISLETLINSPNFKVFVEHYQQTLFLKGMEVLKSCGLTDQEVWAIIVIQTGAL